MKAICFFAHLVKRYLSFDIKYAKIVFDMKITQIQLSNYRNLKSQTVLPCDGLNVFLGDNAQGKTNLAESVYLCCIGKSPRTEKDRELVAWGQEKAHIRVNYLCRYGNGKIDVELETGCRKKIFVNDAPIARTGELMGNINCVYFSPNEIRIISQSPAERRRFMDIDLCQTDKNYFYGLVRYNKALAQRNNALKLARDLNDARDAVFCWDEILAEEGTQIVTKRHAFCEKLAPLAKSAHEKLTDGKETLRMRYLPNIYAENLQSVYNGIRCALEQNLEKDFQMRHTCVGCQRDDISLKINDIDVRSFGSQGQLRTTALSLKLAELTLFKNITGEFPILILDDVLSELDSDRQRALLNFDENIQILLTSATDISQRLLSANCKIFEIKSGTCTELKIPNKQ